MSGLIPFLVTVAISGTTGALGMALLAGSKMREIEEGERCVGCHSRRARFCPQCVTDSMQAALHRPLRDAKGKFASRTKDTEKVSA